MKISGSRVVITGAGSGIGKATALRCSRQGAAVVCVDIDGNAAQATVAECGGAAAARTCDVSDAGAVRALADDIESRLGPVDVLVNNAGVGLGGPFLKASVEDWDWLIGVNLNGVAYGCHAFGERMVERGRGHVVNVASGAAYFMSRDLAAYCASKAGVVALSRCLRADWASHGVGVSAICPGVINTPIAARARLVGSLAERAERAGRALRFGHSPDLVAKAIVRSVERNLELVPVGLESGLAYRLLPFVPSRVQGMATRTPLHRLVR
jgi:NAD(P)-dependent dehydrogenase (short-subunit alcohol dehydrogenase family)